MKFAERYAATLSGHDLRDDAHHRGSTAALIASALADGPGRNLGSLLVRVKYADGTPSELFGPGSTNLAQLLQIWTAAVTEKGKSRGWIKMNTEWDARAAFVLFERVAHASLAYWLDSRCQTCAGAGVTKDRRVCTSCKGTCKAPLPAGGLEREKTLDMVSDLEALLQSHAGRAAGHLRRAAQSS